MRKLCFAAATLGLIAAQLGYAQNGGGIRYKWRDAQGLPHYSDSLTGDAMKYGYDLVNDQGMVIQHVQRQLSTEERAAARQQAAQQAAQERAVQERARSEVQMLNAYPTEAAFRQAQKQELDTLDQQMSTTRINLHSQEKALADLLARAADLERAKQAVPKYLADSIAQQRAVVANQRATLERQQAARDLAEQQAAKRLQRYRELRDAQQQPGA
ncbi:ABC transporter ATPase [Frateuria sp. Soil773]|uniref:DUF4124 domain-containing protein n=1 Tax=Frateuria sp. Soil773 TaxID=1736407 RepID=UPI0006F8D0F6|nr:DUF4124 domain-containing protein [Frateuria sp. Soil773]KRF00518.1 ABC transporter ATPase [Frateuria sp. Soil773]